ncbi:MAG: hypothetical protein AAGI25_03865 [Bacteroidota bacterium]
MYYSTSILTLTRESFGDQYEYGFEQWLIDNPNWVVIGRYLLTNDDGARPLL